MIPYYKDPRIPEKKAYRDGFEAGLLAASKICADEEQRLYKLFGEWDGEHLGAEKCGDLIKEADYDALIAAQSAQE